MRTIHTQALSVGYHQKSGTNTVLQNLDLDMEAGKLVCLLGINGSGKSTLLRTLVGFQQPLSGTVYYEDSELHELADKQRAKKMSVVLTHNQISGMMTVREVVALGRHPYTNWLAILKETDKDAIEEALALTGMSDDSEKYFDELSDGQQQKVVISRAVAQDTPVIVLDEPTNHLDIGNKAEILQLLQSLAHDKKKTVLVSTHDLDLALQMADELWVISGEKLDRGAPEEILLDGILDAAFPYSGIDLFSGKVVRPATKSGVFVSGDGRRADVTRNAVRRLGFQLVTEADSPLRIEVSGETDWIVKTPGDTKTVSDIQSLLGLLETI